MTGTSYRIKGATGDWEVVIGKALDEQGVLNACLAIEERAGFMARPEAWW
jgi:hypothetical protein